ncbi:MAG: sensor histidine kinase [Nocardioides sp.]
MEPIGRRPRTDTQLTASLLAIRALAAAAAGAALAAAVLLVVNRGHPVPSSTYDLDQQLGQPTFMAVKIVSALLLAVAAWLVTTTSRPAALLGYAVVGAGLADAVGVLAGEWVIFGRLGSQSTPALDVALWIGSWTFAVEPVAVVTLYWLYPHGTRARGITGSAGGVAVGACLLGLAASVMAPLHPDPAGPFAGLHNPLGISGVPGLDALIGVGLLLGNGVLVVRWLRSGENERRAFRTLGVVALIGFVLPLLPVSTGAARLLYQVHTLVLVLVVLAAVLRHQLFGIDLVLNRTLVYVTLSALIAGVYAGLAAVAGVARGGYGSPGEVPAAVVAALCLIPARDRVQRLVNRLMYGERDEPFAVVSRIASHLETSADPEQLLERLLGSIVSSLRLPAARLTLDDGEGTTRVITAGDTGREKPHSPDRPDRPEPVVDGDDPTAERFPLVYQGSLLGELRVNRRQGQTALATDESRLLAHTATQAAAAAQELLLREQLLRSRERVIGVAEEERRRLRQDLHDGLGPLLTAAASRIDACHGFLGRDNTRVATLLDDARGDLTEGIGDLRRLVNALRPVVLDELGLVEAVRQRCDRSPVPTTLRLDGALPCLPAAVELAAYRIIAEALTNVARHAGARTCTVTLRLRGGLVIEVVDDGTASTHWQPGVGLTSMRERATELGGRFTAGPAAHGGQIRAVLPLVLAGVPT